MAHYTIIIDKLGDTKIEAEGFTGTACENATQAVELALAGKEVSKDHKPEYYEETRQAEENLRF